MYELWHLHRRALLVCAALIIGLPILLVSTAFVVHQSGTPTHHGRASRATKPSEPGGPAQAPPSGTQATDAADWDAVVPVDAQLSKPYPAIAGDASTDPAAFTRAFATQLFTRDYRTSDRSQLIAWAQYEDAPLTSDHYPKADWSKVLVVSLTDPTWDEATDTPVPAAGPWLALRSQSATQTVREVTVQPNAEWQKQVAGGYAPPDDRTAVYDASLRITLRTTIGARTVAHQYDVSLTIQVGSSPGGGYGVAATNDYLVKEVS